MARSFEFPVGTPIRITKQILTFCNEIDKSQKPYHVPVKPEKWAKSQECFCNVKTKVEKDGGQPRFGWAIWEWRNYYLWADFHAIWISPENEYLDITLVSEDIENTLFLPDSSRKYDYSAPFYRVRPHYYPISDEPLVHELIAAEQEHFDIEETYFPGRLVNPENPAFELLEGLKQKILSMKAQLMRQSLPQSEHGKPGRNAPCPCGSGRKFKKCCGK